MSRVLQDLTNKYKNLQLQSNISEPQSTFNQKDFTWDDKEDENLWNDYIKGEVDTAQMVKLIKDKRFLSFDLERMTQRLVSSADEAVEIKIQQDLKEKEESSKTRIDREKISIGENVFGNLGKEMEENFSKSLHKIDLDYSNIFYFKK